MPRVDDPNHADLEARVAHYLEEYNYLLGSGTYHEAMPSETRRRLSLVNTPTAFYVRGRADRVAVHKHAPLCFLWEAKTNPGPWPNVAIEALPLAHHLASGVDCLYVYWDVPGKFEGGFWTKKLPVIDRIIIPERWGEWLVKYFRHVFREAFVGVRIVETDRVNGSCDPFLIINKDASRAGMFDWKDAVKAMTDREVEKAKALTTKPPDPVGAAEETD